MTNIIITTTIMIMIINIERQAMYLCVSYACAYIMASLVIKFSHYNIDKIEKEFRDYFDGDNDYDNINYDAESE